VFPTLQFVMSMGVAKYTSKAFILIIPSNVVSIYVYKIKQKLTT